MRTTPNRRLTKLDAMRNGQKQRMRGRNRKSQNPLTRVYESNGPDVKVRGTAAHIAEKYLQLARDAQSSGDPVAAENYYQHAEHYFRLIAAVQDQFRQSQPYGRDDMREGFDDGDDEGFEQGSGGGETYMPREQPYPARESQSYQPRESREPREQRGPGREQSQSYSGRGQPQQTSGSNDSSELEQLPAFVTGGAPQNGSSGSANAQNGFEGAPDRFPLHRRRRRRHTPREGGSGEGADQAAPAVE